MIMARLMGGLGNQMFQYAAGLRLAMRHKTTLKLDLTFLLDRTPRENFTYREFDLAIFNLPAEITSPAEVRRFRRLAEPVSWSVLKWAANKLTKRHYYLERSPAFDARVLDLPDETYLEGYFQNERYFADIEVEIRKSFGLTPDESKLPADTRRLADEIRTCDAICLHVRRGDYVAIPVVTRHHGVCGLDYYERGLSKLRSMGAVGRVFVFSDDVVWCRENFKEADGFTVVGNEHAGRRASTHLWLMTLCRHFLISNSSFAWWAAWLGGSANKSVVRPFPWFQAPEVRDANICLPGWVVVRND
jgi:hypothetical protein